MKLKSELAPIEDRGVVFGARDGAAGLDAAVHGRPDQADRGVLRADSRGRRVHGDLRASRPSSTATRSCGSSPGRSGRSKQQQIADELRPKFAAIPGALAFPINPPSLGQSLPLDAGRVRDHVAGARTRSCSALVDRFLDEARKFPGVQNLQTDLRLNTPEVRVNINRDKLSDIGVNVDTVGRTLETMLGGRQVTRFKRDGEQYDVIVQVAPLDRTTPADISDIYVRGRDGEMVQLVQPGRREGGRRAAVAQPLQPAARGEGHRHARAGLHDRRGAEGDGRRGEGDAAADRADRPRRPVARVPRRRAARSTSRSCWRCCSSTSCCRRSSRASSHPFVIMLSVPLSMTGALFALWLDRRHAQHLQPGRAGHAGRPHHQARHPDRRVLQPAARQGRGR